MSTIKVRVTAQKMPHTSEILGIGKAVQHFYYALLFSSDPGYVGRSEVWKAWVNQGFSIAIKNPPPGVAAADQVRTSIESDRKSTVVTATADNDELLSSVAQLIQAIEGHRASDDTEDIEASAEIHERLIGPVTAALDKAGAEAFDSDSVLHALSKDLRVFTYHLLTNIDVTTPN